MNSKFASIFIGGCLLLGFNWAGLAQTHVSPPVMWVPIGPPVTLLDGGTQVGFSRDVLGTLVVISATPVGCGVLVCTTEVTTVVNCFTNRKDRVICSTNHHPTRVCSTNLNAATAMQLQETISGTITPNATCDESGLQLPSNAVFQADLQVDLRQSDWRGLHTGTFKILNGTNVLAVGTLVGSNGVGSHGAIGEACAFCNHLEGTLVGTVFQSIYRPPPMPPGNATPEYLIWEPAAQIQATYTGDLPDVTCPSTNIPQGTVMITLDGVLVQQLCP